MIILERVYLMSIWLNRFNFYTLRFALILPVIGLTACNVTTSHIPAEGIGFREARFAEVSALRTYRSCRDDAFNLDKMARLETSPARYLASAKLFEKCEANLGQEAKSLAKDERMKAYALAVQNYFKAGNIVKAREKLKTFKSTFQNRDLYYSDGSSFIDTMDLLFSLKNSHPKQMIMANVSGTLKSELRRFRYWSRN